MKKLLFLFLFLLFFSNISYSYIWNTNFIQVELGSDSLTGACHLFVDWRNSYEPDANNIFTGVVQDNTAHGICSYTRYGSGQNIGVNRSGGCPPGMVSDPHNVDECLDPLKACFDIFPDLSPDPGNQCVCNDGFLPNISAGGVSDCDGRNKKCPSGTQTVKTSLDGHIILSCQALSVCDPDTDSNGCQLQPDACITSDPDDPCLMPDTLVDNTVPDTCPVGYYYVKGAGCFPITKISKQTNSNTGQTTTNTTVNNGDNSTTTYSSTSYSAGDNSDPDVDGDGVGDGNGNNPSGQDGAGDDGDGDDGDDDGRTASGGSGCDVAPSCSGDEIECAILHQQWLQRCQNLNVSLDTDIVGFDIDSQIASMQSDLETSKEDFQSMIDTISAEANGLFDFSSGSGGGSLPGEVVQIFGVNVNFGMDRFASDLSMIATAIVAVSMIIAVFIIMRV